jgi:hypothetical protein
MDTLTPDRQEDWNAYDEQDERLPRRSRRQFFNRRVAALLALLTCAIGFYAGVRVEKGQLSSSGTGLSQAPGAGTGAAGTGAGGARAGGSAGASAGGRGGGFGAFAGGPGGPGGPGGANASFGTVASVNGRTIYLTEASGNTVKVKVSSATKVSKTQSASRKAIRPGDTIVVSGVPGSGGTVSAATVTDSGVRTAGGSGAPGKSGSGATSGAGGASSSGSSGGGSKSAVGSLFSSGG